MGGARVRCIHNLQQPKHHACLCSKLDYCNSLLTGCHFTSSVDYRKFRTLQRNYYGHVQYLFQILDWLPGWTTNWPISVITTSLTHLLPISLTFPLCTPLRGSLVLLQTHRFFISPLLNPKPLANSFSLTVKQWNSLPFDTLYMLSSHAFKTALKTRMID